MNETTTNQSSLDRPLPPEEITRRRFLEKVCLGLGGLCAAVLGIPLVGFVVTPIFRKTRGKWISVGKITDFEIGTTINVTITDPSPLPWAGITAKTALWLRRVRRRPIRRFFSELHPYGLSCSLARRCRPVYVPLSRRRILQRWDSRGWPAAKAVDSL